MALGALMLDVDGLALTEEDKQLLASPQVGGLILFGRNYDNSEQLQRLVAEIRAVKPEILIAVDQEGGRVQRLREGFFRLPPMGMFQQLYQQDTEVALESAQACGWLMAAEVLAQDIDISFAPVLDVDFGLSEIIGDRSFSQCPQEVTALAGSFISGMHKAGMAATGKHFPGHGGVEADSHVAIPVDERSIDDIREQDLLPFCQLAQSGLDAVMPAHVIYKNIDDAPAGFSKFWLQQVLRSELQFDGVIFSDDLSMEGATVAGSFSERAEAALAAGCDMVLVCNNRAAAIEVEQFLAEQGHSGSDRLQKMRKRNSWTWTQLQEEPMYQVAKTRIADWLAAQ